MGSWRCRGAYAAGAAGPADLPQAKAVGPSYDLGPAVRSLLESAAPVVTMFRRRLLTRSPPISRPSPDHRADACRCRRPYSAGRVGGIERTHFCRHLAKGQQPPITLAPSAARRWHLPAVRSEWCAGFWRRSRVHCPASAAHMGSTRQLRANTILLQAISSGGAAWTVRGAAGLGKGLDGGLSQVRVICDIHMTPQLRM